MGVDPMTLAAIGSSAQGLGQGLGAAFAPAPSYSAAQSDSYQGGVSFQPSYTWASDFNVVGGGANGGSLGKSASGGLSLAGNSSGATATGASGSTTLGQLLPLFVIGGVAWLLLRKKKTG